MSSRHWPHSLCTPGKRTHTLFPSQRRPAQKTCSHRPFDGLFALSSRHWPHSLCTPGKRTHTLSPSQRRPAQKTCSHRPFDGLFACLHVTGHIPFASGTNVNIRFFLHNAIQHRKLVPTDRSMVYLPCLHVAGHISFACGANINIPFRNDLRVPHLETVTTCAPVIYLARLYTARHRLLASGTNILETFAFLLCFCFICQQRHRLRRSAIVLLFAAPFCLPVCAPFCSVVFSTLLRVRRGFLQMGDILVPFLFSFHAGSPEIGRRPHRPFTSFAVFPCTTYTCQVLLWSFLFRSLVCDVLPSALLPAFGSSPVL